jgi:UDPglucose 6-dehydrogenase
MYSCCDNADALLILTEWEDFMYPDFNDLKQRMRKPIIIDGRNLYQPTDMISLGWQYDSIGRPH